MRLVVIGVVALPLFVASAAAQSIRGIVLDDATDEPIAGTLVILLDTTGARLGAVATDTAGRFLLPLERPGTYRLAARRLGYGPATSTLLHVPDSGVLDVEFRLTPEAVLLAPVEVRAKPRRSRLEREGFYRRRELGIGRFMTAEEIEKRGATWVSDALRMEPSVRIRYDPVRLGWVVYFSVGTSGRPCLPLVVLDGTRLDMSTIDELVPPSEIDAMELYPRGNGVPAQFGGTGASCGVILIWTKR
jgi:hypothetical protein